MTPQKAKKEFEETLKDVLTRDELSIMRQATLILNAYDIALSTLTKHHEQEKREIFEDIEEQFLGIKIRDEMNDINGYKVNFRIDNDVWEQIKQKHLKGEE